MEKITVLCVWAMTELTIRKHEVAHQELSPVNEVMIHQSVD